jgi:photosystem II stability/assembly factor-like uncharacterized protein
VRRALIVAVVCVAMGSPATAQSPEASFVTVDVVPVATSETLFGVDFPDAAHGYAVGAYGRILATTDGGATWSPQVSGVEKRETGDGEANVLHGVSFVDATHGWAAGQNGIILATEDGGATWVPRPPPPIESIPGEGPGSAGSPLRLTEWDFRSVKFNDRQSGHVAGSGGTILSTSDGGRSWLWQGDRRFGMVRDMTFPDRQHGQAVAISGSVGLSLFVTIETADAGATWRMRDAPELRPSIAPENFSAVAFADARRGWVGGATGRILATTDAGQHWVVQRRDTTETFEGIAFADARRGLAVGYTEFTDNQRASLVSTADGGETWVSRLVPGVILLGVDFATPTTAFAVGCEVHPGVGPRPEEGGCQKSVIARITFPSGDARLDGDGGPGLPTPLAVGIVAVAVGGLAVLLFARRRPRRSH